MGLVQVEGGFVQGMGWTCLEELVWGDEEHKWLPPGVLHTRGPGATPDPLSNLTHTGGHTCRCLPPLQVCRLVQGLACPILHNFMEPQILCLLAAATCLMLSHLLCHGSVAGVTEQL